MEQQFKKHDIVKIKRDIEHIKKYTHVSDSMESMIKSNTDFVIQSTQTNHSRITYAQINGWWWPISCLIPASKEIPKPPNNFTFDTNTLDI